MNLRYRFTQLLHSMVFGALISTACFGDEFAALDGNQDEVLSGKELGSLKILDADGDGELQRSEFVAAVRSQKKRGSATPQTLFKDRDTNEDGRLSGKEKIGLEKYDGNSDGRITEDELNSVLTSAEPELQGKSFKEIEKIASIRFKELDVTEDGRLTGSEATGAKAFDQNGDGKILQDEFAVGMLLSLSEEEGDSEANPTPKGSVEELLADIVSAMNDSEKTDIVYAHMHDKMKEVTDPFVLKYVCTYAAKTHKNFQLSKANIKQVKLENGVLEVSAKLKCGKGDLTLSVTLLKGQIVALALDSPEMNEIDQSLFNDLQDEKLQREFGTAYKPKISQALDFILNGDDGKALGLVHPSVIEQIGEIPFINLFARVRSQIKKVDKLELEAFSRDEGQPGVYTYTVTFLATDGENAIRFSGVLQRDGLHSTLTGYTVERALDIAPPAPAMDDDVPAPPAPVMDDDVAPPPAPVVDDDSLPQPAPVVNDDDDVPLPPAPAPNVDDGWHKTVSIRDGVQFEMPEEAKRVLQNTDKRKSIQYTLVSSQRRMTFTLDISATETDLTSEHEVFFDTFKNALLNDSGRELLKEDREPQAQFPNQLLLMKNPDGSFMALRTIIAGKNIYRGTWLGKSIDEETRVPAQRFLESIVMIDAGGAPRTGSLPATELPPPPTGTTPAPVVDPIPNE